MRNKIKQFILALMFTSLPCQICMGAGSLSQNIITIVPAAISITGDSSAILSGTINPETGTNSGISSIFALKTNGTDSNYDLVVQSSVITTGGISQSGYVVIDPGGAYLILGNNNPALYPTTASINNIKTNPTSGGNPNAIAYFVSASTSLQGWAFKKDPTYGDCLRIYLGTNQQGKITQSVLGNPLENTYNFAEEKPGIYQATITMSAFRKP